ncbi:MAG: Gfo/Idh/MocA family oxidoreductase [bacterium]|nr:Gfo/Idh/MocA family oxidoreductase [bacterium]MDE0286995.1 Gfo/Idh/MocA family oxidoreductase [bacterium]MDE0437362.1 Gfo/Idh/MocA family oxidoreductase [bacterium]
MKSLHDAESVPLRGGPVLRWGILAPGVIATKFVRSLKRHTDQEVTAVGSRSRERAERFGHRFSIPRAYASYEAVLADSDVDIVYIASPHSHHKTMAVASLEAGKHVLVEKPVATSALEAQAISDAARVHNRFAMEAMHTRFHPRTSVLQRLLEDGELGKVQLVTADLGAVFPLDPTNRIHDPALGGGALLDIGVYSVWFAVFVMGSPTHVQCVGEVTPTGVDGQSVTVLTNESGQLAVATCSLYTFGSGEASVGGSDGRVLVPSRHPAPGGLTLYDARNEPVAEYVDRSGLVTAEDGLCRQAVWAARHVSDGLTQSPLHPLSMSVRVLQVLDEARAQLGIVPTPL